MSDHPTCGMANCNNPCVGADSCGVGYCKEHADCSDVDPDHAYPVFYYKRGNRDDA